MLAWFAALMTAAGLFLAALAAYVGWRRGTRAGLALGVLLLSVAWWGLAYAVELSASDVATKSLWGDLKYFGVVHAGARLAGLRPAVHRPGAPGHPADAGGPRARAGRGAGDPVRAGHARPGPLLPRGRRRRDGAGRECRAGVLAPPGLRQRGDPGRHRPVRDHDGEALAHLPLHGARAGGRRPAALGGQPALQLRRRLVLPPGPDTVRLHRHGCRPGVGPVP